MNTLEKIVPSLRLCKRIPAGEFEDSALVWVYDDVVGFLCRTSGCEQIHKKEWQLQKNHPRKIAIRRKCGQEIYPAPTLEEILDEMVSFRASFCVHGMAIGNNFYGYPTSAEEALLMWLKLKGIEVE